MPCESCSHVKGGAAVTVTRQDLCMSCTSSGPLQQVCFSTPITFDAPGLETNISYRNFGAIFSDIWTLISAELNFIIGGGKIASQKVRHAGPVGSQAYRAFQKRISYLLQPTTKSSISQSPSKRLNRGFQQNSGSESLSDVSGSPDMIDHLH
jgi:hypothetical protein